MESVLVENSKDKKNAGFNSSENDLRHSDINSKALVPDTVSYKMVSKPVENIQMKCEECEEEEKIRMKPEVQHQVMAGTDDEDEDGTLVSPVQTKLQIGKPGDKYEREADVVANRVVKMSDTDTMQIQPVEEEEETLQTKIRMQPKEEEEENIQMKPAIQKFANGKQYVPDSISQKLNSTKGFGETLPNKVGAEMGSKIGADFSGVRIHTDTHAIKMNRELGAQAFTHGSDIYFNRGKYDPGSSKGKHLLAHELTHVVQKSSKIIRMDKQKPTKRAKPEDKIVGVSLTGVSRVIFDGDYNKRQMWNILFKSESFGKVKTHDWCYSPEDLAYIEKTMKKRGEKFNPHKCSASQVIHTLTSRKEREFIFYKHSWDLAKPFMRGEVLQKIRRLIKESKKHEEERKKKKYFVKGRGYQSLEDLTNWLCLKKVCKIVAVAEKEGVLEPYINKLKFSDKYKIPVDFPIEHKDFVITTERKYILLKPKTFIIDNLTFIGYNENKGGWLVKDFDTTLNMWTLIGWSTEACAKNIGDKIYNDKSGKLKSRLRKKVIKP